jgi:hypothetical protein
MEEAEKLSVSLLKELATKQNLIKEIINNPLVNSIYGLDSILKENQQYLREQIDKYRLSPFLANNPTYNASRIVELRESILQMENGLKNEQINTNREYFTKFQEILCKNRVELSIEENKKFLYERIEFLNENIKWINEDLSNNPNTHDIHIESAESQRESIADTKAIINKIQSIIDSLEGICTELKKES